MKVQLNPAEEKALEVGCPHCGQQKGKKCKSIKNARGLGGKLSSRPHKARVIHARELSAHNLPRGLAGLPAQDAPFIDRMVGGGLPVRMSVQPSIETLERVRAGLRTL